MIQELPPIVLRGKDLRKFHHLRRKYPVSLEFLHSNWGNAKRFIIYALNPRCILRKYAWRKRRNRVVILERSRLLLFDPRRKNMIKKRKAHIKQWSSSIVAYYRKMGRISEYEETELYGDELSKQMKQQLELLKSGKRGLSLIEDANKNLELRQDKQEEKKGAEETREEDVQSSAKDGQIEEEKEKDGEHDKVEELAPTSSKRLDSKSSKELASKSTEAMTPKSCQQLTVKSPEKLTLERVPISPEVLASKSTKLLVPKSKEAPTTAGVRCNSPAKVTEKSSEKAGGSKFLDMLMNKVRVKNFAKESAIATNEDCSPNKAARQTAESNSEFCYNDDTSEDFVGFDETAHQPGMLLTPLVPQSGKALDGNGAFVSEALEAYMKENNLREDRDRLLEPMYQDGRVTAHSVPPYMDMPAVPDSLQRLRTVAERRLYLQRSKNQKMAIINNEANIYRELQRKQRQRKVKIAAMQQLQSTSSQMPFTRQGWQAASYLATEHDKYYYQVIRVDGQMVRLPGSQGNNTHREKQPHHNQLSAKELAHLKCHSNCVDASVQADLKILNTRQVDTKKLQKLNQFPLPAIFRPCPLSQKPYQKPLDDDTAALLLAGGSMAIVSMPTVQLDVKPQTGRPLDEIAKRYLQYILPHHDITREWAEFSVSTLQESPNSMREAEAQAATMSIAGRRKSFTFVIPYMNDRNHILVRRVVDRSEQLDENFTAAQPEEKLREFEFRKQLPAICDAVALDCADVINDMINTVAISCSENSFIGIDPDAVSAAKPEPTDGDVFANKSIGKGIATKQQQQLQRRSNNNSSNSNNSRQQRLTKELRRLNATIIDAAAIAKDANKPCIKDFCRLGCVCESLVGVRPTREHCGRAECVLECRCTGTELTRIMHVETDGRGISNEDAFNLRRQATARLAKMEKDFTSTLVLTDNETLLINETQCDKKRRCTKAPKRYEDFDDTLDDDEEPCARPTRSAKREASLKRSPDSVKLTPPPPLLQAKPCIVKDVDYEKLRHCRVALRRLPDVANLATFCMTHQLYNCFCGGLAQDGKPVVIDKEEAELPVPHYVPELATRAHYSFERAQETPPPTHSKKRKKQQQQQPKTMPAKPSTPLPPLIPLTPPEQPTETVANQSNATSIIPVLPEQSSVTAELDTILSYYRCRPDMCRRAIVIPKKCYIRSNRRRRERLRLEIAKAETPRTQNLIEKRIYSAVRYYRAELDNQRRQEKRPWLKQQQQEKLASEPTVIVVRDDSDESDTSMKKPSPPITFIPIGPKPAPSVAELPPIPALLFPTPDTMEKMPIISSCYSLYNNAAIEMPQSGIINNNNETVASTSNRDENTAMDSSTFHSSCNDVIKKMNTLVSKKMQDIDMALKRESKIIPPPNAEILCIIKWTNFLGAFDSDYVFIWDVQMTNFSFLAATITNMMPAICGAIAVVNTRFAPDPSALSLMARMLLEGQRNEHTSRLAVVMQGRQDYWLVKGFLRYMEDNTCTKPTPQSHPFLTKKINILCTLMVKQKIKEKRPQVESVDKSPSEDAPAAAAAAAGSPVTATATATAVSTAPSALGAATTILAAKPAAAGEQVKQTPINICSNVEIRKVIQLDVPEMQIPELQPHDHRWLVLNLYDDFSHIFVPAFRDMISLDRIHNVMHVAQDTRKVVKLQFFQDAPYDAFVTPLSKRKIYFGPLRLDMQPPVLVLLQSVDGKMMLREVYQRDHNIPVQHDRRTMAFWLIQINKQVHFDIEMCEKGRLAKVATTSSQTLAIQEQDFQAAFNAAMCDDDDDDDDCVIINNDEEEEALLLDDDDEDEQDADEEQDTKKLLQPSQKQQQSAKNAQRRSHFTIQTVPNNGGALQITSTLPRSSNSSDIPELKTGFLPFIANMPAVGGFAPATQFLTPQVQVTKTPVPPLVASTDNESPPAKISRISVQRCADAKETPAPAPSKINDSLQQLLSGGNNNIQIGSGSRGVTITKLKATKEATKVPAAATTTTSTASTAPATVEEIKIGSKRKSPQIAAAAAAIAPAASGGMSAESMLEQIDMPSLGKLESLLMHPLEATPGAAAAAATTSQESKTQVPAAATKSAPRSKMQFPPAVAQKYKAAQQSKAQLAAAKMPKIQSTKIQSSAAPATQQANNQLPAAAAAQSSKMTGGGAQPSKIQSQTGAAQSKIPSATAAATQSKIQSPAAAPGAAQSPKTQSLAAAAQSKTQSSAAGVAQSKIQSQAAAGAQSKTQSSAAGVAQSKIQSQAAAGAVAHIKVDTQQSKVKSQPKQLASKPTVFIVPRSSLPAAQLPPTAEHDEQPPRPLLCARPTDAKKSRYGYFVADGLPRYRVKMMDDKLVINVPEEGIFSFKSSAKASAFLNRCLSRKPNLKMHLPADWKFSPTTRSTPIVIDD
ncbi:GH20976 [Drosophila grimshawi]|uniref:GH20976 n=1 Tax=Drosophila grimshawi TaxID=7222 RepID=B4J4S3_DROGR|nr:GH20976 [Drosophila grimshawi]